MTSSTRIVAGRRLATVVVHDVTEEAASADAVRLSEERLRALFTSGPIEVVIIGSEGKIIDANPAFDAMLGMPILTC